jgi:phosphate-selective porin OprO and OprP
MDMVRKSRVAVVIILFAASTLARADEPRIAPQNASPIRPLYQPLVPAANFTPGAALLPPSTFPALQPDYGSGATPPKSAGAQTLSSTPDLSQESAYSLDFKDGVAFKTSDKQFSLKINSLLQIDYRGFSRTAGPLHTGNSLHDNFAMPRIRLFFRGNATEFVDYAVSVNTGLSPNAPGNVPAPVNLLDAYLDFNPFGAACKEYFQVRVGRFKTPYTYQFYKISPQDFATPELSMFTTNFLQNWETGIMAHGVVLDKRLEYAAGLFNGVPNSFEVTQNDRQGIFYLGWSPFVHEEGSVLQRTTIAASYAVGHQFGNALPGALGTAVASNGPPDNALISPIFLQFNGNAIQKGYHDAFALDLVWSYRSLNFYGEYNSGTQTYGLSNFPATRVPVSLSGYSATVTYFFTGEEISPTRARVKPLQPYNWCARTWGALEGFGRFSHLTLGSNVLTSGLVVPDANANQVDAVDLGFHWYPNEYLRLTFDWQHSWFNHPISLAHGSAGARTIKGEDLFWLRWQMYY